MDRVLFFDCDGVFSTPSFKKQYGNNDLHFGMWTAMVARMDALGVQLVLNSMWRRPALLTGRDPRSVLPPFAMNAPFHDDAATPWRDNTGRGDWILAWLTRHPDVTVFANLDDEAPSCLLAANKSKFSMLKARTVSPDPDKGVYPHHLDDLSVLLA